ADHWTPVVLGGAAWLLGLVAMAVDERLDSPAAGAAAGALVSNALLRLPQLGANGTSALLVAMLVAPLLLLAWREITADDRRQIRWWALRGAGVIAAICLVSVVVVGALGTTVNDGVD